MHGRVVSFALGLWLVSSAPAFAARVTEVADAADLIEIGNYRRENLWDVNAGFRFEMEMASGKITREPINLPGITSDCASGASRNCLPVDELKWNRRGLVLRNQLEVGVFHDLAFTFGWRYILEDNLKFDYAKGVDATNSTVDPQTGVPGDALFAHNFQSFHAGSGPLDLGLKWAPLSDLRDDSKPDWVLLFNWQLPSTAATYDPNVRATRKTPGAAGDGVHRLTFGMAFGKRMGDFDLIGIDPDSNRRGFIDPYVELSYTLPVPDRDRALAPLHKGTFARSPSHTGQVRAGLEVIPIEDLKNSRKVALDFGVNSIFFSEGRNYSLLTDPLRRLTYEEQHFHIGGVFGVYVQAAEFVQLHAGLNLGYTTEHFLTFEEAGNDVDGDGNVSEGGPDELNPNFCGYGSPDTDLCAEAGRNTDRASFDQVGFRFKDGGHSVFSWFASLIFTF